MSPELWGARDGEIAVLREVNGEAVVSNFTCLFEAGHAFSYFDINNAFDGNCVEVVLVYDFLGNDFDGELHVFVNFEGGFVIKIFYV